jgi:hypothetical protein
MADSCDDSAHLASDEGADSGRAAVEIAEHAALPRIKGSGIAEKMIEDDGAHRTRGKTEKLCSV